MSADRRQRGLEWACSGVLLLTAAVVLRAIWPVSVDAVLRLDMYKNTQPIRDLDQSREITLQRSHWVDVLDLSRDGRFAHPKLGELGLGEHYFVDLLTRIEVSETGSFRFEISSDDGFALQIDERRVCAFTTDRAMSTQTCTVLLLAGTHQLKLNYFQGGGPAGLAVRYATQTQTQTAWHWLGEDSAQLRFVGE